MRRDPGRRMAARRSLRKAESRASEGKSILHVDMDAFFVSVERALDPSLEGKPVVVVGRRSKRGVVSSASYEARSRGVRSAMPLSRALRLCPEALVIEGNFSEYARHSKMVMEILARYSPLVEPAGIDEAYLDLTGCHPLFGEPRQVALEIKRSIKEELGLPSSAGLSSSMIVSKVASSLAKPDGFLEVPRGREADFLALLPVDALPGVGPACSRALAEMGIKRIGELALVPPEALERAFGSAGRALHEHAVGIDRRHISTERSPRSVSRELTFESDTLDYAAIKSTLLLLCEKCCAALREESLAARRVGVKVRYSDFKTRTKCRTLELPTDRDQAVFRAALELAESLISRSVRVRLVGVNLSGLVPFFCQGELFPRVGPPGDPERADRLNRALDLIRARYGFGAILRASTRWLLDRKASPGGAREPGQEGPLAKSATSGG